MESRAITDNNNCKLPCGDIFQACPLTVQEKGKESESAPATDASTGVSMDMSIQILMSLFTEVFLLLSFILYCHL